MCYTYDSNCCKLTQKMKLFTFNQIKKIKIDCPSL